MRLPRMTTRRWMIAVAVVAVPFGVIIERHRRFQRIAREHWQKVVARTWGETYHAGSLVHRRAWDASGHEVPWHQHELDAPHLLMVHKYLHAMRYPWLPVPPDPPQPE